MKEGAGMAVKSSVFVCKDRCEEKTGYKRIMKALTALMLAASVAISGVNVYAAENPAEYRNNTAAGADDNKTVMQYNIQKDSEAETQKAELMKNAYPTDITGHWAEKYINQVLEKGYMGLYLDGRYSFMQSNDRIDAADGNGAAGSESDKIESDKIQESAVADKIEGTDINKAENDAVLCEFRPGSPMTRAMFTEALAALAGVRFEEAVSDERNAESDKAEEADTEKNTAENDAYAELSSNYGKVTEAEAANRNPVSEDVCGNVCETKSFTVLSGDENKAENELNAENGASDIECDDSEAVESLWGRPEEALQKKEVIYVYDKNRRDFEDLDGTESYAAAASWARSTGIINGIDGKFMGDMPIDRQTMAVMMYRASDMLGIQLDYDWSAAIAYNDIEEISDWAAEGIIFCAMTGLMSGDTNGYFAPKRELTRAEGAAVIMRMAEMM